MDRINPPIKPAKRHAPRMKQNQSATQVDAAFIFGALKRWTLIAIPIALIFAAAGGGAVYFLYEPEFKATSAVLVKKDKPYIAFPEEKGKADALTGEVEILKSPRVFGPLLSSDGEDEKDDSAKEFAKLPEVRDLKDPVVELPKMIRVGTSKGSELMNISFTGPDPENAAKIVNSVVNQYLSVRTNLKNQETKDVLTKLEIEKNSRTNAVKTMKDRVRVLAKEFTGRDPFAQQYGPVNQGNPISDLTSRATGNTYSQRVMQKEIEELEAKLKEEVPPPTEEEITNRVEKDPNVVAKKREHRLAQEAYEQSPFYKAGFGPKHPTVNKLVSRIKLKKAALDTELQQVRPRVESELALEKQNERKKQEAALESLKSDLVSLRIGEQFLKEEIDKQVSKDEITSDELFTLEDERKKLLQEEETLNQISARIFALETERKAPERIILLYPASIPKSPVADVPYKTIGLVGLFGLCLPFGLAILWEIKVRRFSHADQITDNFDTPIVAEVANLPRRALGARRLSSRLNRELKVYEESVDSLRTNLMLAMRERNLQVIAVSSSISGEGKTSLATQLSISISKAVGKPTLLVDGDMRAPDIHRLFEIESKPGLAEVLAGKCELEDAVVESQIENLDVLPAGMLSANPAFLLSNGSASKFFKKVREEYEYIILDTPPILSANESMLLADAADGTLFCVMRDTSRYAHVKTAWQRISSAGGQPVGVVFNNVTAKNYIKTYGNYDYQLD